MNHDFFRIGFTPTVRAKARRSLAIIVKWLAGASIAVLLLSLVYTFLIGRDRAVYNTEVYENARLVNAPHSEQLYIWEGYGLTTYGENGLVVDKAIDPDKTRLLFIGDSLVEAKQVSDAYKFSELVEVRWNAAFPDHPVQALNVGKAGEDMRTYLSFGRNMDAVFAPDEVFVLLSQGDLLLLAENAALLQKLEGDSAAVLVHSTRLNFLQQRVSDSILRQFFIRIQLQTEGFVQRARRNNPAPPTANIAFNRDQLGRYEKATELQLQALKDIWGERLVIIYNPRIPAYGLDAPDEFEPDTFSHVAAGLDIPVINLYEPMIASYRAMQSPRGFNNTTLARGHFNQTGHAIIAGEIISYLQGHLSPGPAP